MVKSVKEKPEFDQTAYHFPTFYISKQFHEEKVNLPSDFTRLLQQKKKAIKTDLRIYAKYFTFTDKTKRQVEIHRVRRYLTTGTDNIIIILINGVEKEQASYDAFYFKTKEIADEFIQKLRLQMSELRKDETYQKSVVDKYYERSGLIPSTLQNADTQSVATSAETKDSAFNKLTDEDFNYGSKRTSIMDDQGPTSFTEENKKMIDPVSVPSIRSGIDEDYSKNIAATAPKIRPSDTAELLLSDYCDMTKVHAPKFGAFPYQLPTSIAQDLESQKLEYSGQFKAYEDGVEFTNDSNDTLFKAKYHEIVNIHEFPNQPTNILLFRNDLNRRISQMVLLNFDSRKTSKNAVNILKNQDIDVIQYIPKVSQTPMQERSYVTNESGLIKPSTGSSQKASASDPSIGRSVSFAGNSSKFYSVKIKRKTILPPKTEEFNEDDLKEMPDEGTWDYNIVYLNENQDGDVEIADSGNVYMFVAHKLDHDF